VLNSWF